MPLWVVIIGAGITFCGWVFLKARRMEAEQVKRKVKEGSKDVKAAAKHVAKQPSGVEVIEPVTSKEEVNFSGDISGKMAKELEEILRRE